MVVSVTVTGLDRVLRMANNMSRLQQVATDGLEEGAGLMVNDAKTTVHVITGRLKNSIKILRKSAGQVEWGSQVEYAGHEEFGNSKRPPHPYARPALQSNLPTTANIVRQRISTLTKG